MHTHPHPYVHDNMYVYPSVTRAVRPAIPPPLIDTITVKLWLAQLPVDFIVGITEVPGQTALGVHSWSVGLQPVKGRVS